MRHIQQQQMLLFRKLEYFNPEQRCLRQIERTDKRLYLLAWPQFRYNASAPIVKATAGWTICTTSSSTSLNDVRSDSCRAISPFIASDNRSWSSSSFQLQNSRHVVACFCPFHFAQHIHPFLRRGYRIVQLLCSPAE